MSKSKDLQDLEDVGTVMSSLLFGRPLPSAAKVTVSPPVKEIVKLAINGPDLSTKGDRETLEEIVKGCEKLEEK